MGTLGPTLREQISALHGKACWLCDGLLDFGPNAAASKKPTIEHLHAISLGGSDALDNLRLCHHNCNQRLSNRSLAEKEAIRAKFRLDRDNNKAKMAAARVSAKVKTADHETPPKPAIKSGVSTSAHQAHSVAPASIAAIDLTTSPEARAMDWQRVAMIAIASATFFAGLSLGMLIA